MAVSCQTIINLLEAYAPSKIAAEWDQVGLQTGRPEQAVASVFLSLDLNETILAEALRQKAVMLVVHHSPFFEPVSQLRTDQPKGKLLQKVLQEDLVLYTAHTNLDLAQGGVNDVLAQHLTLQQVEPLTETGWGRCGLLPQDLTLEKFIDLVQERLAPVGIRYCSAGQKTVKKVALCGGSGANYWPQALSLGADVYLTADLKYHEAQEAVSHGLALVDAGHFATEYLVMEVLANYLRENLKEKEVRVIVSQVNSDPFCFYNQNGGG